MRTKNSIINTVASLVTYILITISTLIAPRILKQLGEFEPGINALFVQTISFMNVVELGIGIAIVYKLYEPIEKKDYKRIAIILNFYKKAFYVISSVIVVLGSIVAFIVPNFLDKKASLHYNRNWVSFIFMFYVLDVLASYLFAHKRAMITADQKNYINNICHGVGVTLACISQIIVLKLFHSFLIYAIVKVIFTVLENVFICVWYNSKYKFISLKIKDKFSKVERNDMFKNLKALFLHKIATAALRSTPGLVVSKLNTIVNGYYSVYMLVVNGFISFTEQTFGGITASFGNLIITSSEKLVFSRFKTLYFINYFLYSVLCTGFFNCVNLFIEISYGKTWVMDMTSVNLILLYFFIMGMRQSLLLVKISAGIYRQDRYFALLEAVLNIILTIVLGKNFGIKGVLSASVISMLLVPMWTQPYLVYKNVFKEKLSHYYKKFVTYLLLTIFVIFITSNICNLMKFESAIVNLIVRILISASVPLMVNLILFWKTEEMNYMKRVFFRMLRRRCKEESK